MTREEAINYNKNLIMYMRLSDKNHPYKFLEENYIALDMAIKALEQEPCEVSEYDKDHIWYKGRQYISLRRFNEGILEYQGRSDVLNKIKAEIEEHVKINQNLNVDRARALCWCLDVIDKYSGESEGKE